MRIKLFLCLLLLAFAGTVLAAERAEVPAIPGIPAIGDRAPDFELKDSKGKSYRLSEFKGKNVVVEFIRSGSW